MPSGEAIEFRVIVNNAALPEYRIKDQVYAEVDLHGPGSYSLQEDDQKYPVLPFEISVVRLSKHPLWISIYLDGQRICARPLCGKQLKVSAVKDGERLHELLFSLPRMVEPADKKKTSELAESVGTIQIVCAIAEANGEMNLPVFQQAPPSNAQNTGTRLLHLTKHDVSQPQSSFGVVVSREGKPTAHLYRTRQFRRAIRYVPSSEILEQVVLHYRPRIYSTMTEIPLSVPSAKPQFSVTEAVKSSPRVPLGDVANQVNIVASANQAQIKTEVPYTLISPSKIKRRESVMPPLPADQKEEPAIQGLIHPRDIKKRASEMFAIKKRASEMFDVNAMNNEMSEFNPLVHGDCMHKGIKQRASEMFESIRIKTENLDDSFIIIDDSDEYIFGFEEGDSVIYMGDDDCQILDISSQVSMISLDNSISSDECDEKLSLHPDSSDLNLE